MANRQSSTPPGTGTDDRQPKQEGDILGISDTDAHVKLPVSGRRDSASVEGIEVGSPATGIGDIPQRSGASGADLGGREGADVTPSPPPGVGTEEDE